MTTNQDSRTEKFAYRPFPPVQMRHRLWPSVTLSKPPIWCSVDLRDGNQALPNPMTIEQKIRFFQLLVKIGFKQIEVGFPSASDTEYQFVHALIHQKLIPDDVTIQVLVPAREYHIRETARCLVGARKVIIHLYNSTSPAQREIVFGFTKEQTVDLALQGVRWIKKYAGEMLQETQVTLQYSPESFSATEIDFSHGICTAVMNEWQPTPDNKIIINLPCTVEVAMPNVYADQVEYMCQKLGKKGSRIISVHTHNDRGTGLAATELAMLAGADRVEGTLFGNGERTGNLDIINVALNLHTQGISPGLDFSNLDEIRREYEELTGMRVHERHPYAGELVFTAFSGSHQDAVKKGFQHAEKQVAESDGRPVVWNVPYFIIDPREIGRTYEPVRINSQSGKGGLAFVLERGYNLILPKEMHADFSAAASPHINRVGKELPPEDIEWMFRREYVELPEEMRKYELVHFQPERRRQDTSYMARVRIKVNGLPLDLSGNGNGPVDAFVHALSTVLKYELKVVHFAEHSLGKGSNAEAIAYVCVELQNGEKVWGVGTDDDIANAPARAVLSALNRSMRKPRG